MSLTADQKLKFIHGMTKLALDKIPHYDLGGFVGDAVHTLGQVNPIIGVAQGQNPLKNIGLINQFSPGAAPITPGTNPEQLGTAYTGAQGAIANQQGLVKQTQPGVAQGLAAQSQIQGQLLNQAAGQGPNPAQAALNQATGRNIAGQAALQASQRGASANPGAVAAEAARTGSDIQQQAVGQSATLQAQQQIAAEQAAAGLAAQQYGQGAGAIQGENAAQQGEQGILQGANTAANNALVGQQSGINTVNAGVAAGNQKQIGNLVGGLLGGASSALGSLFAEGGEVHAAGSEEDDEPVGDISKWLNSSPMMAPTPEVQALKSIPAEESMARGGKVKKALPPMRGKNTALVSKGGKVKAGDKSEKSVSNKDAYANDKVPALLSEGEVVMDKDTLNDPGPIGQMARAVAHHIETRNAKGRKHV